VIEIYVYDVKQILNRKRCLSELTTADSSDHLEWKIRGSSGIKIGHSQKDDLPQKLVPHVKLGFSQFLFLNSGVPLVLEDGNSKNYAA
jgi:hypothetical protein